MPQVLSPHLLAFLAILSVSAACWFVWRCTVDVPFAHLLPHTSREQRRVTFTVDAALNVFRVCCSVS